MSIYERYSDKTNRMRMYFMIKDENIFDKYNFGKKLAI